MANNDNDSALFPPKLLGSDGEDEVEGPINLSSDEEEENVYEDAPEAMPPATVRHRGAKVTVRTPNIAPRVGGVFNGVAWTGQKPNHHRETTAPGPGIFQVEIILSN
jgi:hypothetical protein